MIYPEKKNRIIILNQSWPCKYAYVIRRRTHYHFTLLSDLCSQRSWFRFPSQSEMLGGLRLVRQHFGQCCSVQVHAFCRDEIHVRLRLKSHNWKEIIKIGIEFCYRSQYPNIGVFLKNQQILIQKNTLLNRKNQLFKINHIEFCFTIL